MRSSIHPSVPYIGALSFVCVLALSGRAAAQETAAPSTSSADEKVACIAAFEDAQVNRAASLLLEARQRLLACSSPACGNLLRSECTQMFTDVERALPSVVLAAKVEGTNHDLTEVEVLIDGQPLASSLDGKPVMINPGEYELTFKTRGHAPLQRRVVVGTGEKYRQISVVFPESPSHHPAPTPVATPVVPPREARVPVMSYVLGGVSVVGLGSFAVLRVIAASDFDTLKSGCSPSCSDSDVSRLRNKYVVSNVALGTGLAAAGGAILWYVLDNHGTSSSGESVTVGFEPVPGGGVTTAARQF